MSLYTELYQQYQIAYTNRLQELSRRDTLLGERMAAYKFQLFLSWPRRLTSPIELYVCGLKPYARAGHTYEFPPSELPEGYHAYLDESWSTPYVPRALQLIEIIQQHLGVASPDPRRSLVSNWFFQRAEDARQLRRFGLTLSDGLPWHRQIIDAFRPKMILCIGNGATFSSFAGMCQLHGVFVDAANTTPYIERSRLKYMRTADRLIVGVPHLSRYAVTDQLTDWLTAVLHNR